MLGVLDRPRRGVHVMAQRGDTVRPTACRRCGQNYGWRGGISFAAIADLGRRIREHYEADHPGVDPSLDDREGVTHV